MRILLSKTALQELRQHLLFVNNCKTLTELSATCKIPRSTLEKWFYGKRYIPAQFIPQQFLTPANILQNKQEQWGQIKGGQKTYRLILKKYGISEIRKRQQRGGINSSKKRNEHLQHSFSIDATDARFLEFYGALLGDGWLSSLSYQYKTRRSYWWIGISGHAQLDRQYLQYLSTIIRTLFQRKITTKFKKNSQGMEILFCHKPLILFLNKTMKFPIGPKTNLAIDHTIATNWDHIKPVLRGIFDTDGCFYLDKTPAKRPYPCISIHMHAPKLLSQVNKQLLAHQYTPQFTTNRIVLKGSKQINKWMQEIGSNNQKHISKYQRWKSL